MNIAGKLCPKCGKQADWKTYIQKHVCSYCGWTGEVASVFKCRDCQNVTSFEVTKLEGNDDVIFVICKDCGSVTIKHLKYLDDNSVLRHAVAKNLSREV